MCAQTAHSLGRTLADGDRETVRESDELILPGSITVARNGDIYVSNNSVDPVAGEAARLP